MKRFLAPLLALLLFSCAPREQSSGKLKVAASFYPLAFLAEQIGDDLAEVAQITPGGREPHDYEPSPQELKEIEDAKVFIMNGGGIDAWADKVIDSARANGAVTLRMADALKVPEPGILDGSGSAIIPSDPHHWLDPVLFMREATLIRDALLKADPSHADTYRKNADTLIASLKALDQEYRSTLSGCALKDIVVSHDAFRYLGKEYGFGTIAIAGIDPEQEPEPKRIAELTDLAREKNISVIFFETLASPKLAETIASEIGAKVMVLNPIEGLTAEDISAGRDYFRLMRENLLNLRTALQCQ